jgi:hypothetical protein
MPMVERTAAGEATREEIVAWFERRTAPGRLNASGVDRGFRPGHGKGPP